MGACCSGGDGVEIGAILIIQKAVRNFLRRKNRVNNVRSFIQEIAANQYATTGEPLFDAASVEQFVAESTTLVLIKHNRELKDTQNGEKEYRGQWKRQADHSLVREGLGILTMSDGSFYSGQFSNNEMTGNGRMQQTNGNVYQGEWSVGKANGHGVFNDTQQNATYDGEWVDDLQHGIGKETINGGQATFEGQYF